jgi:protein-S-isoprenylcysteine O-methyltransferase Ste14
LGAAPGVPLVAVVDWNSFVRHHPTRDLVAALFLGFGWIARTGYSRLGVRASVALPPSDGRLEFVVGGPYAESRKPQYVGAAFVYFGVAIAANSGLARLCATLAAFIYALMSFAEEPWLRERYGLAYDRHALGVPRFLPHAHARVLMVVALLILPGGLLSTFLPSVSYPGYDPVAQHMSELAVPRQPGHALLSVWWTFYGSGLVAMGGSGPANWATINRAGRCSPATRAPHSAPCSSAPTHASLLGLHWLRDR